MNNALLSSKNMCWCTPPDFFAELDREFHFELDPARSRSPNTTGRSADRWISPTSRTPIRIRNQRKRRLQLLHRYRIQPANLWI